MRSICGSICQRLASRDAAWWNHWNSEHTLTSRASLFGGVRGSLRIFTVHVRSHSLQKWYKRAVKPLHPSLFEFVWPQLFNHVLSYPHFIIDTSKIFILLWYRHMKGARSNCFRFFRTFRDFGIRRKPPFFFFFGHYTWWILQLKNVPFGRYKWKWN